jgi:hypothetical protein
MAKTKLYIYVSNAENYLKGNLMWALYVTSIENLSGDGWFLAAEIEVELKPNEQAMKDFVLGKVREEKKEVLAKLELLEIKEKELLSVTHQEE